jgi:hypothetical protein
MICEKTLHNRAFAGLAAAITLIALVLIVPPSAAQSLVFAAVDEPDRDGGGIDAPDRDTPQLPENRRGSRAPSEDGTDAGGDEASPDVINPDLANPDDPPGCPYTHQPLELLI